MKKLLSLLLIFFAITAKSQAVHYVQLTGLTFIDVADSQSVSTLYCAAVVNWQNSGSYSVTLTPCATPYKAQLSPPVQLSSAYLPVIPILIFGGSSSLPPTTSQLESTIGTGASALGFTVRFF